MLLGDETIRADQRTAPPVRIVAILLAGGLLGHLIAAYLNGGSQIAYLHHVAGFFFIAAVTGLPIAILTRLFWRRHFNLALVIVGLVQLVLGMVVMIGEWRAR